MITASTLKTRLGDKSIVLIGPMGSGKSSVGKRLAIALDMPFQDADTAIEEAAQQTIADMFQTHGEQYFRDGEQRVIARIVTEGSQVLATGGGAWMNAETRQAIAEDGISVWLNGTLDILMERVSRRSNRPLLQTANPRETMKAILKERNPVYALADVEIASRDVPHEVIVDDIINGVSNWLSEQQKAAS